MLLIQGNQLMKTNPLKQKLKRIVNSLMVEHGVKMNIPIPVFQS